MHVLKSLFATWSLDFLNGHLSPQLQLSTISLGLEIHSLTASALHFHAQILNFLCRMKSSVLISFSIKPSGITLLYKEVLNKVNTFSKNSDDMLKS